MQENVLSSYYIITIAIAVISRAITIEPMKIPNTTTTATISLGAAKIKNSNCSSYYFQQCHGVIA